MSGPLQHENHVINASFSPDGMRVVTASWDNTSRVTLRQIAERERDFSPSSRESLESALRYDATLPLARMMLANMQEKEELAKEEGQRDAAVLARAAHWRRYDLDRLPDDPKLWARAAEILRQLPEARVGVGPKPTTAVAAAQTLQTFRCRTDCQFVPRRME